MRVDGPRLLADLAELGAIGATADGGVSRLALSEADRQGREWFRRRAREAGFAVHQDGAGNLSARLPADDPAAPTLLVGSHLDTVANGGRFDGALGVVAALEVLRTLAEREVRLAFAVEAISFTDEEGTILPLLGSRALAGRLVDADFDGCRGGREVLAAGLAGLGSSLAAALTARREARSLRAYVELHIEQGTRLEEAGLTVGVVTGIVGVRSAWLRFRGRAGHAGTLPMDRRADALLAAARFVDASRRLVMERFSPGVMNCGRLEVSPGAFNIVPAEAVVALEMRHGDEAELAAMEAALLALAHELAAGAGCGLDTLPATSVAAAPCSERVRLAIAEAAESLGLGHMNMPSFAGHDGQSLAGLTPFGMLFVPCAGGVSHHPSEHCSPEHCVAGADALLATVLRLAAFEVAGSGMA